MAPGFSVAVGALLGLLLVAGSARAQSYEVIAHFGDPGGGQPLASLIEARDGNLYGTTRSGGLFGNGTIFRLVLRSGKVSTLHSFSGPDGAFPFSTLVEARDGRLYGTTEGGGTSGLGTVFRVDRKQGRLKILHSFTSTTGQSPLAGLIQASDGAFYGTTSGGGPSGNGTVYRIDHRGRVTVLHAFEYWRTGAFPRAGLIQARDGFFYGVTAAGGASNVGIVFRMDSTGAVAVLHTFDQFTTGSNPTAALIQASDGLFYGTTSQTLFQMDRRGAVRVLHSPGSSAPLIEASDNSFYATGCCDAGSRYGTVFRVDRAGTATVLHAFDSVTTGAYPQAALLEASDGYFYGVAQQGGKGGAGTIFRMDRAGVVTVLHAYGDPSGANPFAPLLESDEGMLYGTALGGGAWGLGTVFRIESTGRKTVLHAFDGVSGALPSAPLIQASDGTFYGTTIDTVFRIDQAGELNVLQTIGSLEPLLEASDGFFYGVTPQGGEFGEGAVFRIDRAGKLVVVHSFDGTTGREPMASLIEGSDGLLYGTTAFGGAHQLGTVFRMTRGGDVTVLHSFFCERESDGSCVAGSPDGISPQAALIEASDGSFYGTALEGGAQNGGTIFRIDRAGVVTVMHSFDFQTSGVLPRAELIQAEDGAFYGTTEAGGAGGCGTVFRMDPNGAVTVLHAFDRATGAYPYAPLVQAQDGFLYGTASEGGRYGAGVVFRIRLPRGVTLASPNGGETLVAGVATTLRWTATGTPTAFDLELSRDAGHTFEPIAGCAGLAGPARSCDWTPDGPSTRRAILRVTARYGVVRVTDQSDARFVISAAPPRKKAAVPQAHAPRPIGDFVVDRGRKDRIE